MSLAKNLDFLIGLVIFTRVQVDLLVLCGWCSLFCSEVAQQVASDFVANGPCGARFSFKKDLACSAM